MPHQSHASHRPLRIALGAAACAVLVVAVLAGRSLPSAISGSSDTGRASGGLALASSGLPFTMLCQGFTDCANKGYSDAGYGTKSNYNTMYWDMYSGSNCVNYVAYRMIKAGMSSTRPANLKPGKGNAEYWGTSFPNLTNTTPSVGSIAWWKGGATGAGSEGHVAYVEKVVSPDDIIVSESNWGSPFDWREITGPTDWPSGFIHMKDQQIEQVKAPRLLGTPTIGKTVRAAPGKWSPHSKISYQWKVAGKVVSTAQTYSPATSMKNQAISLLVTASPKASDKSYAPKTVTIASPTKIARGTFATTTAPGISGKAQASLPLTLAEGDLVPSPLTETVQWLADGQPIAGATGPTYTPTVDQIGQQISAQVVEHHLGYVPLTVATTPTPAVIGLPLKVTGASLTGSVVRGGTVTLDPGTFNTDGITPTIQWKRGGVAIPGATSTTYQPTTADVGHRLSVTVTASKATYANYTKTYAEGEVGTQGQLAITATGLKQAVRVHVRLSAPGFGTDQLNRTVRVAIGPAKTASLKLDKGVGTVVLPDVRPGKRTVSVTWAGSSMIKAVRTTVGTRVLTPKQAANKKASGATAKQTKASSAPAAKASTAPTAKASSSATASKTASSTPSKSPSKTPTKSASSSPSATTTKTSKTTSKTTTKKN